MEVLSIRQTVHCEEQFLTESFDVIVHELFVRGTSSLTNHFRHLSTHSTAEVTAKQLTFRLATLVVVADKNKLLSKEW